MKSCLFPTIDHTVLIGIDSLLEAIRCGTHVVCIVQIIYLVCYIVRCICHVTPVSTVSAPTRYSKLSLTAQNITHVLYILLILTTVD